MGSASTFLDEATETTLNEKVAKSGKTKSEYIKDLIVGDLEGEKSSGVEGRGRPTQKTVKYKPPSFAEEIMDTYKEAIKVKTLAGVLGIPVGAEQHQPTQYPPWMYPAYAQQPPQKQESMTTKEMMDQVTLFRMIDGMGEKAKDPEATRLLNDIKTEIIRQATANASKPTHRDEIKEMMDRVVLLKSVGASDEAKDMQTQLFAMMHSREQELREQLGAISQAQEELREAVHQRDLETLNEKIEEIKKRPSELDKIRELSELAKIDPAVEAYMRKRLGIEKGGFNVKDLGEAFRSMNINVGDFVDALSGFLRTVAGGKTPTRKVPAPPPRRAQPAVEEEGLPAAMAPPEALEELHIESASRETVEIEGLGTQSIPVTPVAPAEEVKIIGERPQLKETTKPSRPEPKPKKTRKPKGTE